MTPPPVSDPNKLPSQSQSHVCVFITAVPITKLFAWGEGDSGGHVLRETTSRGMCGLVCPSRTSERGGEGHCVKEGGGEEGSARGSVHWGCDYAIAVDIEVDPQRRRFSRRESDFALQALEECRAFETERVRFCYTFSVPATCN